MAMLRALRRQNQFTASGFEWAKESIEIANRLVRCKPVHPSLVELSVDLLHSLMDCSNEIVFTTRKGGVV
jgi:hypothetical protein